jgi:hypothetical protein
MTDVVGSFTAKVALRVRRVIAGNLCSYILLTSLIFSFFELEKISKAQKSLRGNHYRSYPHYPQLKRGADAALLPGSDSFSKRRKTLLPGSARAEFSVEKLHSFEFQHVALVVDGPRFEAAQKTLPQQNLGFTRSNCSSDIFN